MGKCSFLRAFYTKGFKKNSFPCTWIVDILHTKFHEVRHPNLSQKYKAKYTAGYIDYCNCIL